MGWTSTCINMRGKEAAQPREGIQRDSWNKKYTTQEKQMQDLHENHVLTRLLSIYQRGECCHAS